MTKKESKTNKISKKKIIIDKYTQPIYYPHDLIVIKNASIEDIKKRFTYTDGNTLNPVEGSDAITFAFVKPKNSKKSVILVVINDCAYDYAEDLYLIGLAAHEALHVAHDILEYAGEDLTRSSNESYAYVVEWATKCIYKTIIKK